MGRTCAVLGQILVCLALTAGCRATEGRNLLGWLPGGSVGGQEEPPPSSKANPFRNPNRTAASSAATGRRREEQTAGPSDGRDRRAGAGASVASIAGGDPELQRLLEQEVRHMPPGERDQFLNDLQGQDPPFIRHVLRVSRMARRMRQEDRAEPPARSGQRPATPAHFEQSGGRPGPQSPLGGHSPVVTAGGRDAASPGEDDGPPRADAGLGEATPWNGRPSQSSARNAKPGSDSAVGRPGRKQDGSSGLSRGDRPAGDGDEGPARVRVDAEPDPPSSGQSRATIDEVRVLPPDADRSLFADLSESLGLQGDAPSGTQLPSTGSTSVAGSGDAALQELIAQTADEVAAMSPGETDEETREYIEKQVALRALYLMDGQQARALEAIPGIDAADQEFWQQVFWAMANYFDAEAIPDPADRATQTIEQLRSAVQRLQEKASLELRNVAFCHKILSFGNYERFERDEFSPGQSVLVYAEVRNFDSELTSEGRYRTALKSTIEIYKAGPDGGLVERIPFPTTEDECQNYRRDYFHSYEFAIPQRITLGPHVLKLTVEDQLSQKVATYSLNFMVK